MLKFQTKKIIDVQNWDNLVQETYGRPYSFQQQEGCQERGTVPITIPSQWDNDDQMFDSIEEVVNGEEMGVKFSVWLSRDPKQPLPNESYPGATSLFWERSFYPDLQTVANDLYTKGLVEAGDYLIDIDW